MGTTDTTSSPPTTSANAGSTDPQGADFLAWLEEMRDRAGISWAEVSRRSRISENGLRRIRQGEATPRPATREALVGVFEAKGPTARAIRDAVTYHPGEADFIATTPEGAMPPIPARRGEGLGTVVLVLNVATPRAANLAPDTAKRLQAFLEQSARAWLLTADCDDDD